MERNTRDDHQHRSANYLRQIADTFALDPSSGIYKPNAVIAELPKTEDVASSKIRPVWVNVVRDWPTLLISLATLIFLIATVYYSRKQWKEAQRTAVASVQAAYAACVSAQVAAESLESSDKASIDTHNLSLGSVAQAAAVSRAESAQLAVLIQNIPNVSSILGKGMPYLIENFGKSPALRVRVVVELRLVLAGTEPPFKFTKGSPNWGNTGAFGPGVPAEQRAWLFDGTKRVDFSPQDVADIDAGRKYVYLYGRLTYSDIFGVKHWTNFCQHYWGPNNNTGDYPKCFAYNTNDTNMLLPINLEQEQPAKPMNPIPCKKMDQ